MKEYANWATSCGMRVFCVSLFMFFLIFVVPKTSHAVCYHPVIGDAVEGGVSAGYTHSAILVRDGSLGDILGFPYTMGRDDFGQLGNGEEGSSYYASPVYDTPGMDHDFVKIVTGLSFNLALDYNGDVWVWGSDSYGQLGLGSGNDTSDIPQKITHYYIDSYYIVDIAAGDDHAVALSSSGHVFAWGSNMYGQVGASSYAFSYESPQYISGINGISKISAKGNHTLALNGNTKRIWAWGNNEYGQLGLGYVTSYPNKVWRPKEITSLSNVTDISAGINHSLAVQNKGKVYGWGGNYYHQLGFESSYDPVAQWPIEKTPRLIKDLHYYSSNLRVYAGAYNSFYVLKYYYNGDHYLYGMGSNQYGLLGVGHSSQVNVPTYLSSFLCSTCQIGGIDNNSFYGVGVDSSRHHTLVSVVNEATDRAEVWASGLNTNGQLGDGSTISKTSPTYVRDGEEIYCR